MTHGRKLQTIKKKTLKTARTKYIKSWDQKQQEQLKNSEYVS